MIARVSFWSKGRADEDTGAAHGSPAKAAEESVQLFQVNPRRGETRIFPAGAVGAT